MIAANDNVPAPAAYRKAVTNWVRQSEQNRPSHARGRKIPYAMNVDRYMAILEEQGWVCALTGLRFMPASPSDARLRPSVDRIDHTKGYVPGNCRIVIQALNVWMNYWGDTMALPIARAIVQHQEETQP